NPKFGQTFMWPDGTTVTMGPPEVFTPDKIYYWGDKTAVKFLFTLENHSGAPLTPMEFEFNAKSADANMGLIVGGGIMDLPAGTLADGDSLELYVGCETVDINDMEMEFDPETDDTHDAVTFTT
ncbi:MAG: hypothetical protein LBR33_04095, partial [Propionibacteriaceae bacterium]|nr:hypothetical protein [Propionibacteriaceae bacterium]